jgi:hypothetical protein
VPPRAVCFVADQLGVAADGLMAEYAASEWRWRHAAEIRERYGYRSFSAPSTQFQLNRWLYALCWTGSDRPSILFDRATAWLVGNKVLLPGASTLERAITRVRTRAARRLWRQLLVMPVDLAPYPAILAYLRRIGARDAYRRAMRKGDPGMVPLLA